MNNVPSALDWTSLYHAMESIDGVSNVRDLHVWSITSEIFALSMHADAVDVESALGRIKHVCDDFGIKHTTVQVHPRDGQQSKHLEVV